MLDMWNDQALDLFYPSPLSCPITELCAVQRAARQAYPYPSWVCPHRLSVASAQRPAKSVDVALLHRPESEANSRRLRCPTGEVQNRQARAAAVAKSVCGTLGVLSVGTLSISRDTIFHWTVAVSPFFSAVPGHGYVL